MLIILGLVVIDFKGGLYMVSNIVKGINWLKDWGLVKVELYVWMFFMIFIYVFFYKIIKF